MSAFVSMKTKADISGGRTFADAEFQTDVSELSSGTSLFM